MSDSAAQKLMDEHRQRVKFHPFAAAAGATDLDGAYAIQDAYVRLQSQARGVSGIGYKVGLTSPRMQAMCKIDRPIAGVVLQDRLHQSGVTLDARNYGRVGLEFELAVRLARDLDGASRPDLAAVAAAVDAVCPAMEIVDDRHCDYATLDVLSLVADNSWNAGVVLGAFSAPPTDLVSVEGVVSVGGKAEDRGQGSEVLGHPYQSVIWLARHLAERGQRLSAGDIVMTGNWVTTKFPAETSAYRFEIGGLGAAEVTIRI
jgi:2-keto-4-pentenoate hydratase